MNNCSLFSQWNTTQYREKTLHNVQYSCVSKIPH